MQREKLKRRGKMRGRLPLNGVKSLQETPKFLSSNQEASGQVQHDWKKYNLLLICDSGKFEKLS